MNPFLRSSKMFVARHGKSIPYVTIERVIDKITGKVTEVKTTHSPIMYPKSVKVNQYNYPDLIGKDVIIFYLANDEALGFTPKVNDTILFNGKSFVVRSYDFHEALGINCLYRITGAA